MQALVVAGGISFHGTPVNWVQMLLPPYTGRWKKIASLPKITLSGCRASIVAGRMRLFGGRTQTGAWDLGLDTGVGHYLSEVMSDEQREIFLNLNSKSPKVHSEPPPPSSPPRPLTQHIQFFSLLSTFP